MNTTLTRAIVAATVLGLSSLALNAGDKIVVQNYTKSFQNVSAAELPATAAGVVARASAKEREATTEAVVKAAVGLNPASAPAIVGAIARTTPDMAATAARVAAALQPKQAGAIARAAAEAAPSMAGRIVEAVCKVVPSAFREVANAVAQVVPKANSEILDGVASALPSMKGAIAQAQGRAGSGNSVDSVLQSANQISTPTTPTVSSFRGPMISGPYVPITTPPTNAPPGSGIVPPGGRNYARP